MLYGNWTEDNWNNLNFWSILEQLYYMRIFRHQQPRANAAGRPTDRNVSRIRVCDQFRSVMFADRARATDFVDEDDSDYLIKDDGDVKLLARLLCCRCCSTECWAKII